SIGDDARFSFAFNNDPCHLVDDRGTGGFAVHDLDNLVKQRKRILIFSNGFALFQTFGRLIRIDGAEDVHENPRQNTKRTAYKYTQETKQPLSLLTIDHVVADLYDEERQQQCDCGVGIRFLDGGHSHIFYRISKLRLFDRQKLHPLIPSTALANGLRQRKK
ncbi:MAG: hypothetical protein P8K79_12835, partial [Mariniblastus sp.]|nr:hypothetical protein [Mariniblastus sp.]